MRMSGSKCVLFIVVLLFHVSVVAQQKAGTLKLKPHAFENIKGEKTAAEFGTLLVPEKRGDPQSSLIELAFVRFKSTAPNPGPPIVYLRSEEQRLNSSHSQISYAVFCLKKK